MRNVKVIFEDNDVLVVDKPSGISVHPRVGEPLGSTIAGMFRKKLKDKDANRPGIVHRLDKDTSGVLILAKNIKAKDMLQKQFRDRSVRKKYVALVQGTPDPAHAQIEIPIGRHAKNPIRRAAKASGKLASTEYEVIQKYGNYSLLEVTPSTGRTHQIRVHLAHIGHPVVGDRLYGKEDIQLDRHFLHAKSLSIILPSNVRKTFSAPWPVELKAFLHTLH